MCASKYAWTYVVNGLVHVLVWAFFEPPLEMALPQISGSKHPSYRSPTLPLLRCTFRDGIYLTLELCHRTGKSIYLGTLLAAHQSWQNVFAPSDGAAIMPTPILSRNLRSELQSPESWPKLCSFAHGSVLCSRPCCSKIPAIDRGTRCVCQGCSQCDDQDSVSSLRGNCARSCRCFGGKTAKTTGLVIFPGMTCPACHTLIFAGTAVSCP